MNYEEATQIAEKMVEQAHKLASHYGHKRKDSYPFVVGCLMAEIRALLMGTSQYSK